MVEALRPGEGLADGGARAAGVGRHELPAGPKAFVGRRAEIGRALEVLGRRRDEAPVATITGRPGVGKTALALVLAHHLARTEYPDDQLFISLDSRLPVSPADALYDRLLAFGVPPANIPGDLDGRRKLYLDALRGRRALVVLDDVTTAEQVRALWPPSGCAAIVTGSVEFLKIFKDGAETLRLQPLTILEAMRFLTNRIGRRRVVREPLAALRIVRACERVPLALACLATHLTAARGRYLVLRSFARRLRHRRTRLDDLSVSGHEGVEPALAQIYQGLNQYQRRVFDVIGHLDAPELDAELVAAVLPTTLADAESVLAELVDEGLLEVAGSPGERWQPHELVRRFACQVAPGEDRQAVVERAVAFHLKRVRDLLQVLAAPAARLDHPRVAARARAQLERERAAGSALVDQAVRHGLDLAGALVDDLVALLLQTMTGLVGCAESEAYEQAPFSRTVRLLADLRARQGTKDANRSVDSRRLPAVSPHLAEQNGTRVAVVIPARNEQASLAAAVRSVLHQTQPAHRIVVVVNNSDDRTEQVARGFANQGVEVVVMAANPDRKAGALNHVITPLLVQMDERDAILTMDADTELAPDFIATAVPHLLTRTRPDGRRGPLNGAVGGLYYGRGGGGLLGLLQRNEFHRYNRWIARRGGRAFVIIGTGSLYLVGALREVAAARTDGRLYGPPGLVFDPSYAVEDYELTIALLQLGWGCVCPRECQVTTDVMPTFHKLFHQRVRWRRGTYECLARYRWTRVTAPYIWWQIYEAFGLAMVLFYLAILGASVTLGVPLEWPAIWLWLTGLFVVEHMWTVRRGGWRGMAVAAPLILETAYHTLQLAVIGRTLWEMRRGTPQRWLET